MAQNCYSFKNSVARFNCCIVEGMHENFNVEHEKNDFVEVSKNLAGYKSKNNFVGSSK